ncbi:DUF1801 domain-containing protein [Candidatus Woesebacteria bacterium]|nr:DUF1801 domain-containing protein [Candidatus Woesebacteria bacterium]
MAELKTKVTTASVIDFINTVSDEKKKEDAFTLLKLFEKITAQPAKMWGTSIIGFGKYHYKSERSRQEGDWPLVGFSPRKQNLTLYIMSGFKETEEFLQKVGKHKKSVGCLYINKLDDIDITVLEKIIQTSYLHMKKIHGVKD